jgi:hypothetical protein
MLRAGVGGTGGLKWVIAALPVALLVPTLLAYLRFLRQAEELARKIQMEGAAMGFWVGVASSVGYILLDRAGMPRPDPSIILAVMFCVMALGFGVGQVLASKRYR